jgi:hypothetical protein
MTVIRFAAYLSITIALNLIARLMLQGCGYTIDESFNVGSNFGIVFGGVATLVAYALRLQTPPKGEA